MVHINQNSTPSTEIWRSAVYILHDRKDDTRIENDRIELMPKLTNNSCDIKILMRYYHLCIEMGLYMIEQYILIIKYKHYSNITNL